MEDHRSELIQKTYKPLGFVISKVGVASTGAKLLVAKFLEFEQKANTFCETHCSAVASWPLQAGHDLLSSPINLDG